MISTARTSERMARIHYALVCLGRMAKFATDRAGHEHGQCIATDPAGDQVVDDRVTEDHELSAKSVKVIGEDTSGTGKYAGVSGGGTAILAQGFRVPEGSFATLGPIGKLQAPLPSWSRSSSTGLPPCAGLARATRTSSSSLVEIEARGASGRGGLTQLPPPDSWILSGACLTRRAHPIRRDVATPSE
jgi:hypothetical protein